MNPNILEARGLHFSYEDGTNALNDMTFTLPEGSATAILGGNGAGKSTFLLTLNGILKPSSGEILFKGSSIDYSSAGLNRLRRQVGMVFQSPDTQLFSASVVQDISFGLYNLQLPEEEIRRRIDEAMERTGITHVRHKPVHWLSYGQKKRVAIAGVLVMQPSLLVLDEPTAGLDPKGASSIMRMLGDVCQETGMTMVVATHDLDTAALYCDRGCVVKGGRVLLEESIGKVFEQKDVLREAELRLTRIGHLMEILHDLDGFELSGGAMTISAARASLRRWSRRNE